MNFSGDKVAIITGASRGIGAGLVDAYRKRGYRVIANSRNIVDSHHPEVVTVAGDIADPRTAERLVIEAAVRFGRIDTLINNAGVFIPKPFICYTPEDYELVTSVNTFGFFHITQRVIAEMLAQGNGGHVVNITATLAEQSNSAVPSALTALTKGGLTAVTKSLAIEYAAHGIRVNAISPGVVDTSLHVGIDASVAYAGMHPQNRIGDIADIVHGALYLETAPFVTGEVLHIDGGQSAGR
ncbi:SDR family oxidoreductase [Mycobacterium intracellulare]|uniref:SDR family oxidoreductase n=1 Tax=Mycobacterium intracellulare TaxID=1767 RepID=A0AAE4U5E9_MYCIT|nr:SDR family oxidoreductase [Mycobacterium intracellulare]MCA2321640.1 SDR family oxidoreductase [Mycobacterium intracellulare]MCA2343993.1 SDR family oxidoreductase [Mycobacterium intracellulare]MDV6979453.1 SDR family oxidoreductase [Mycobacterium intracellulare]MDV6984956.1 SDR family oxidoreductase [Mycobacterium intracellulare]MDV7015225.1 SDR family oxidoreductase [Mycobacterium intracellulare]